MVELTELKKDIKTVEGAILTLNKEMGIVQGELTWIRRLMTVTALGVLGQLVVNFFG